MTYCSSCGKNNNETAKFCGKCGNKLIISIQRTEKNIEISTLQIAHGNKRFINGVVDYFGFYISSFLLGYVLAFFGIVDGNTEEGVFTFVGLLAWFLYYVILENTYGKTLGKMLTKTTVVGINGDKPELRQIILRTLVRLVPLEVFSFIGSNPVGWHDKWAKTVVVSDKQY